MSLSATARANLERYAPAILSKTEDAIRAAILAKSHSPFRDEVLSLGREGAYSAFYAPFDWVNDDADVVIVGVTSGRQQAAEALCVLRRNLLAGETPEEAARLVKGAASFKGNMRKIGARLMDHFHLHEVFGLSTTHELFERASARVHYTSVLGYPVLRKHKGYPAIRASWSVRSSTG